MLPSVFQANFSAKLRVVVHHITPCCTYKKKPKKDNDQKSARGDGTGKQANSDNIAFLEDLDAVLLQVVPLRVFVKLRKAVTTYAMLDSWSEITLVTLY